MSENPLMKNKMYECALNNGSAAVLHTEINGHPMNNPSLRGALHNPTLAGARKALGR